MVSLDNGQLSASSASGISLQVICTYPEDALYNRAWRYFALVGLLLAILRIDKGYTSNVTIIGHSFVLMVALYTSIQTLVTALVRVSEFDANWFIGPAILLACLYAMILVLLFSHKIYSYNSSAVSTSITVVIYIFASVAAYDLYALLPRLSLTEQALITVSCDSKNICNNPCVDSTRFPRTEPYPVEPILWNPLIDIVYTTLSASNTWISQASKLDQDGFNFLQTLPFWSWTLGPVFYTARVMCRTTPSASRNAVFHSLQQSRQPKDIHAPAWELNLQLVLFKLRHVWLVAQILFFPFQILSATVGLVLKCAESRRAAAARKRNGPNFISIQQLSKLRYSIGKSVATAWYIWALLFPFLLPAATAFVFVQCERGIRWFPNVNHVFPLPVWLPLSTLATVLAVAALKWVVYLVRRKNSTSIYLSQDRSDSNSKGPETLHQMATELSKSNMSYTRQIFASVLYEWRDFALWWHDPMAVLPPPPERLQTSEDDYSGNFQPYDYPGEINAWAAQPESISLSNRNGMLHRQLSGFHTSK